MSDETTANKRKHFLQQACVPQRFILAFMGFLGVVNAFSMRSCLAVAITEMVESGSDKNQSLQDFGHDDSLSCPVDPADIEIKNKTGKFDWDEKMQGLILGAFYWGYAIGHIPAGYLAEKFGGKYTLGLGILWTSILTLLTPLAADYGGAGLVFTIRLLEGLGEGTTIPALNVLLAHWAPPGERSRLGTLVFAGAPIGNVISSSLSGLILEHTSGGWPIVFYTFGIAAIIWFIFWIILCYNDPVSHPFISDEEKAYLDEIMAVSSQKQTFLSLPWKHVLTSLPVWALIVAQIGHDWSFFTLSSDLPKYLKDVMKFNIKQNGLLSAIPQLCMWIGAMGSSCLADFIIGHKILPVVSTRKIFTTVAFVGGPLGMIAASYAGCDRTAAVIYFTCSMTLMGTFYPGFKVNVMELSPNYAGTLMALVNGAGALTGIITPYIIGVIVPDRTLLQWRKVFFIVTGVSLLCNVIFCFTASGDVQPWNDMSQGNDKGKRRTRNVRQKSQTSSC